jgi:hypothetical protein
MEDQYAARSEDRYKQRPIDPKAVEALLESTRQLNQNEAILIQFVTTPTGRLRDDQHPEFYALGRLAVAADYQDKKLRRIRSRQLMDTVLSAYRSLHVFTPGLPPERLNRYVNERRSPVPLDERSGSYIPQELPVMFALPIGSPQVPGLVMGKRRLAPDPAISNNDKDIVLGEANFPGRQRLLAVTRRALTMNLHGLGPQGSGKTTLAINMAVQGMRRGDGLAYFDPHGDAVKDLLDLVPKHRINDVVLLDIADPNPLGYNPLAGDPYRAMGRIMAAADGLFDIYRMPRTADLLRNVALALASNGRTLADLPAFLDVGSEGKALRRHLAKNTPSDSVKNYWQRHNEKSPSQQLEITDPLLIRMRPFEQWPELRAIVGQTKTTFSLKDILATNKILLVSLPKGGGHKEVVYLTGSLLMAELWDEIQARIRMDAADRAPFIIYLDEFKNWVNGLTDFAEILNENRKYGAGFVLLHQQMSQIEKPALRQAVAGGTRSKLTFQTNYDEATSMAREFGKPITAEDIQGLGPREVIVSLLSGDSTAPPATMHTLKPPEPEEPERRRAAAVRAASQARYGRDPKDVENELARFRNAARDLTPQPSTDREEDWAPQPSTDQEED